METSESKQRRRSEGNGSRSGAHSQRKWQACVNRGQKQRSRLGWNDSAPWT